MSTTEAINQIRQQFPGGNISYRIDKHDRLKISYKGPDGIIHPIATRVNRDATSRARLQHRYYQRKHFDILDIIDRLLRDGTPAVLLSDNTGTMIFYNTTRIDSSKRHKLIKIEPWYYSFESISESEFNQLRQQLKSSSGH